MDFQLPQEYRLLRRTIQDFRDNEMIPLLDDLDPDSTHLPESKAKALREKAKEQGLWAMGVPEEYGGGGLGILGRVVVLEELSQHRMGLYGTGMGAVTLTPGITVGSPEVYLETANEYHLEKFIEPALRGELSGTFALTEPAAGSDPTNIQTRAEKKGNDWIINGEKRFITGAGWADYAMLFANAFEDGEEKGLTCFLVDTDAEGWDLHRRIDVMRPLQPYEIHLDNLQVPDENRFGDVGAALRLASSGVRASRIPYSAQHVGVAIHALNMGIEYAKERETFGKPLSERQAIQWMIADSAVDIHTARLAVYETAWKADNDIDVRHEASMIKLHSSEMLQDVLDNVIQIHGGLGVSKDLPLERWYRETRVRRIAEGPSEIQRRTIARNLIKGYESVDLIDKNHP